MSELEADYRVVNEAFAKCATLVSVFDRLLVADAGEAKALDDDADPFVVEVRHDHYKREQREVSSEWAWT